MLDRKFLSKKNKPKKFLKTAKLSVFFFGRKNHQKMSTD